MSSASLYGGTYNLFHYTLPKLGIEVSFVDDPDDLDAVARRHPAQHQGVLRRDASANPKNDVLDIEGVAGVAHERRHPADRRQHGRRRRTCIRPFEWGADIVVHSATKFIGGHGTSIGGVIVDGGTFDFGASGRFPMLHRARPELPRPRSTGRPSATGPYIIKARVQLLRDIGAAISPFNAFLFLQGLETL